MRVLVYFVAFSSLQGGGCKMRLLCLAWHSASFGTVHLKASGAGAGSSSEVMLPVLSSTFELLTRASSVWRADLFCSFDSHLI